MILLGSTLLNAPILGIQTGGELARTSTAIIDPSNLSVIAYRVTGPLVHHSNQLIRVADVRELSSIGLIIDSSDEFVIPEDIIKLQSICELHFDIVVDPEFHVFRDTDEQCHTFLCILLCKDRCYKGKSLLCTSFIESFRIMLLDIGCIGKHY